jgi:type IV secretory pathway TrbL component
MAMTLINLIVILVIIGVVMWAINTYVPMSAGMKKLLNIVVVIAVVLWLLKAFGLLDGLSAVTVG